MGTPLGCVLAVDKGIILLAVMVGVGEHHFYVFSFEMNYGIEGIANEIRLKQVEQSVATEKALAVEGQRQPRIQIRIVAEHVAHILHTEFEFAKQLAVGQKLHKGAVAVFGIGRRRLVFAHHVAALEVHRNALAVAHAGYHALGAQGVYGFQANAVKTHRLLEILVVELAAGVDYGRHVNDFAQRDAASVIAHRHAACFLVEPDVYAFAGLHVELVNGVVYHLLEQHINAVVGMAAVAQLAYVHTGTKAYMLFVAEVLYRFLVIRPGTRDVIFRHYCLFLLYLFLLRCLCHFILPAAKIQIFRYPFVAEVQKRVKQRV